MEPMLGEVSMNTSRASNEEFWSVVGLLQELVRAKTELPDLVIDMDTPFLELGLDSIQAVEFSELISNRLGVKVSPTLAYEFPTIREAAAHLAGLCLERRTLSNETGIEP